MAEDVIGVIVGLIAALLILDLFFFGIIFPTEPIIEILRSTLGIGFLGGFGGS